MKTIMQLAKENQINKICINGQVKDIRQLDKTPFNVIPKKYETMENTIYNEGMIFCWI